MSDQVGVQHGNVGEENVERDDQADARQHLDPDQEHEEGLAAGEAVLLERDGGEECEHHRDPDRDEHDDHRVLHVRPEVRLVDRVVEVPQGRLDREPRRRAIDLVVRLERRRDHPEDREGHDREESEAENVPAELACEAWAHSTSPTLTIRRT